MYFYLQLFYCLASNFSQMLTSSTSVPPALLLSLRLSICCGLSTGGSKPERLFLYLRTERKSTNNCNTIHDNYKFERKAVGYFLRKVTIVFMHSCLQVCAYLVAIICKFIDSIPYISRHQSIMITLESPIVYWISSSLW